MTRSAIRCGFVMWVASGTALGCDGGCNQSSESSGQAAVAPSTTATATTSAPLQHAEPSATDGGAVVHVAPNGEYWVSETVDGGTATVGQLVSQDGAEYWWLYPSYRYPSLNPGAISITYKLATTNLSGFEAPTPASHKAPLEAPPAGSTFIIGKAAKDSDAANQFQLPPKRKLSMQVDPMYVPGYIDIFDGSVLIGQVVALSEPIDPDAGKSDAGKQAPPEAQANEHWFILPNQSQYPTDEKTPKTVTFQPHQVDGGVPDWWVVETTPPTNPPTPKHLRFLPDKFVSALGETASDVVVSCQYWKN